MVKEICFVTGNPFKVLHARVALRDFGVSVVSKQVEMIEPREEEPEMVARQKALQAFKVLNQPLMVEDSGEKVHNAFVSPGGIRMRSNSPQPSPDGVSQTRSANVYP